jgi:hypothetical protein
MIRTTAVLVLVAAQALSAQSTEPETTTIIESETTASQTVDALPVGESKPLEALVIEVRGSVRWRAVEDDPFKTLELNDIVAPGAEIRTALRSGAKLRIGHNATVDIHSVSRIVIPEMIQQGDTLRTRAVVRRGRADFKVDKVGLVNDFQVITPSTTLAVRGTWFAVAHGGLLGTTIEMFDPGEISSAEIRYFARMQRSFTVNAGQRSNERSPDPVANGIFDTFSPPPDQPAQSDRNRGSTANARRVSNQLNFEDFRKNEYGASSAARTQVGLGVTPEDPRRREGGSRQPSPIADLPPGLFGGSSGSAPR